MSYDGIWAHTTQNQKQLTVEQFVRDGGTGFSLLHKAAYNHLWTRRGGTVKFSLQICLMKCK